MNDPNISNFDYTRRKLFAEIFGVERPLQSAQLAAGGLYSGSAMSVEELACDNLISEIAKDFSNALKIQGPGDIEDVRGVVLEQLDYNSQTMFLPKEEAIPLDLYSNTSPEHRETSSMHNIPQYHQEALEPLRGMVEEQDPRRSQSDILFNKRQGQYPNQKNEYRFGSSAEDPGTAVPTSSSLSKKPSKQGFGIFSNNKVNGKESTNSNSNNYDYGRQSPVSGSSRTASFSSATLRNFTSTFQHKRKNMAGKILSQKHNGSQGMLDVAPASQAQFNNGMRGHSLRTRHSSASLNASIPGRYAQSTPVLPQNSPGQPQHNRSSSTHYHKQGIPSGSMKLPHVYPAMLSRVATQFKKTIQLGEHKKDGILYRDAFTGQAAVDVICSIIRTSDRNLALLLGRALDAQKLFHDVVYEHRLRDSPNEMYEFTGNSRVIGSTGALGPTPTSASIYSIDSNAPDTMLLRSNSAVISPNQTPSQPYSMTPASSEVQFHHNESVDPASIHGVNGVFVLLAECYSATCTRDKLCYSISCPRRLEQQARLNLKPNGGLQRNISLAINDDEEEKPSWTSSVDEAVWSKLSKTEIKRQEAIYEVYITEKNFVKSLEIIRDTFMKKLAETNIISADIRKNFIKHVFAHVNDIYSVNRRFLNALNERQKASPIVEGIGDVFLQFIPFFEPFILYVASRPYAKYLIETQRSVNPYFARFDEDLMNSKLRHGIDSFLSQGVSRPGRYVLLVREIIKSSDSEKNKRDLQNLTRAMDALKDFMKRIDNASGAAQDRHDVKLLKQKLLFKNEYVNLGLGDERRKILHEGLLSRKELTKSDNTVAGDIQFYLLDNMLLFLKAKPVNKWNQHKVFQRPIPLPLLFVYPGEDMPPLKRYVGSKPDAFGQVIAPENSTAEANPKNALTFLYYGAKQRYQVTLYAAQYAAIQTLLEKIRQAQTKLITGTDIFNITKVSDGFFDYSKKINNVAAWDGGRKMLIATNQGLFLSNIRRDQASNPNKLGTNFSLPVKIVQRNNITQVAVMEEFQTVLLLVDKKLYSCHIDLLYQDENGTQYFKKHAKEIVNHVSFFSEGYCNGKRVVVTAHASSHSIKWFEHEHPMLFEGSKRSMKRKINDVQLDSEPVSISFLRLNLCIGCKKGFQIVSITQNAHEPFLDPADTSLEFALKDTLKPIAIYRVSNMFFLCYSEFAFFVNNQGWRKRESHTIYWEGEPEKFAIWYPYILAFDPNFIEIRKIDTGELVRCLLGDKIRMLHSSSQETIYVYEDERGYDTIASLDFWGK
ncbi:HBL373Cp [Eremothecium sinecaudum]|uniref:HBL373Cp n=1 Tax=Eremothecium sinecaudum TaxID=45286 RepID=A0A120K0N7_9SACH|nr:HBL373Cp [Eremothecium sinecaudum]AMD18529.1 HBL373Cp [Eremothecium sinecaudum]